MEVSIGVMAHNEEKNIGRALDSLIRQRGKNVRIMEIVVVSSGSSDRTNSIVEGFCRKDMRVILVKEPERRGKSSAINLFLERGRGDVKVLVSGDVVPGEGSVEGLCSALSGGIGMAAGRVVPEEGRGLLGKVVDLEWRIHHEISLKRPKFGEMVAFRGVSRIAETSVDEEFIGMLVNRAGFKSVYVPRAVVRNRGPRTIKDFIRQRRRIYAGHLELSRKGYCPATLGSLTVLKGFVRSGGAGVCVLVPAAFLEAVSRLLGLYDFIFNGKKHLVWDMIKR